MLYTFMKILLVNYFHGQIFFVHLGEIGIKCLMWMRCKCSAHIVNFPAVDS